MARAKPLIGAVPPIRRVRTADPEADDAPTLSAVFNSAVANKWESTSFPSHFQGNNNFPLQTEDSNVPATTGAAA